MLPSEENIPIEIQVKNKSPHPESTLLFAVPGPGLAATLAARYTAKSLQAVPSGPVYTDEYPLAAVFHDGVAAHPVGLQVADSPKLLYLESDVPLPGKVADDLATKMWYEYNDVIDEAIFLTVLPRPETDSEDEEVNFPDSLRGIATTEHMAARLDAAGIKPMEGSGVFGRAPGVFLQKWKHAHENAALLAVPSSPRSPDPDAAEMLIKDGLEPLLDIEVDTSSLGEDTGALQERLVRLMNGMEIGTKQALHTGGDGVQDQLKSENKGYQ